MQQLVWGEILWTGGWGWSAGWVLAAGDLTSTCLSLQDDLSRQPILPVDRPGVRPHL